VASVKTQISVGLFVIVGFTIGTLAVIWLGMSNFLEKGQYYVAYFDESVQGLDKDSSVKYRGVSIGHVKNLGVAPDGTLIEAVIKIETDLTTSKDLVAQLKSVGITGIMFIELDHKKKGEPDLSPKIAFSPEYPVIATKPSDVKIFMEGIGDLIDQFRSIDIVHIAKGLDAAIESIHQAVSDARTGEISSDLRASIKKLDDILDSRQWETVMATLDKAGKSFHELSLNADDTVGRLGDAAAKLGSNFDTIEKDFNEAVTSFDETLEKADDFFDEGSALFDNGNDRIAYLQRDMGLTLRSLRNASDNLNRLIETLETQPSQLIFGEPPSEKAVEPDPLDKP